MLSVTSPADIVAKIKNSQVLVNASDTDINDVEEQVAIDTETVSEVNDDIETGRTTSDSIDNALKQVSILMQGMA